MDKRIAVVVPNTEGDQVRDVVVRPGMTTHDIRAQASIPQSYFISPPSGLPWGENEPVYGHVVDGMKVFAAPAANVA